MTSLRTLGGLTLATLDQLIDHGPLPFEAIESDTIAPDQLGDAEVWPELTRLALGDVTVDSLAWLPSSPVGPPLTALEVHAEPESAWYRRAMISASKLAKRVSDHLGALLEERGFRHDRRIVYQREGDGLVQLFEVQPGHGGKRSSFTVNVGWRFTTAPVGDDSAHFAGRFRIGQLLGGSDLWFSRADVAALDNSLGRLRQLLTQHVLPFLDRYRSVATVIEACEADDLSAGEAFGSDDGWQRYLAGFCYLSLGDRSKAREQLAAVVALADEIDPTFETPLYREMLESAQEHHRRLSEQE